MKTILVIITVITIRNRMAGVAFGEKMLPPKRKGHFVNKKFFNLNVYSLSFN